MTISTSDTRPALDLSNNRLLLTALIVGSVVGDLSLFVVPFMIEGWMTAFQVSEGQVGFVISLRLSAFVLSCLALSTQIHLLDRRRLALIGTVLIVLGSFATALAPSVLILIFARMVAGIGEGIVMTTVTAIVAETKRPEKTYSLIAIGILVSSIGIFLIIPPFVAAFGVAATFAMLGAVVLVTLPIFWVLSPEKAVTRAGPTLAVPWTLAGAGVMMAFIMLTIGAGTYWFYAERIGERSGMDLTAVGEAMVIAAIVSIIGPVAAHQIDIRFGRLPPIVGGFLVLGISAIAFTHATSAMVFAVSLGVTSAALAFCTVYLLGLAAALDSTGRLAGAARGFAGIGTAIAPGLGGSILLAGGSYETIGWVCLAASLTAIAAAYPALKRIG